MIDDGLEVLFICSVARTGKCSPAVREQARCLKEAGLQVSFFGVEKGGFMGYLTSLFRLRRFLHKQSFQVIHAHYGLSGVLASLAGARPLVVSLMGSDVLGHALMRGVMSLFVNHIWRTVVVKSPEMAEVVGVNKVHVIPNGVDLSRFRELARHTARQNLGVSAWRVILWPASPARKVKDYALAERTVKNLNRSDCQLLIADGVPAEEMPLYYNAADVVLITSRHEGSPNVVKEALACNVPVVSTPVGDVEYWLNGLSGCSVCPHEPESLASGLERALQGSGRCKGRARVQEVNGTEFSEKIITLYRQQLARGTGK